MTVPRTMPIWSCQLAGTGAIESTQLTCILVPNTTEGTTSEPTSGEDDTRVDTVSGAVAAGGGARASICGGGVDGCGGCGPRGSSSSVTPGPSDPPVVPLALIEAAWARASRSSSARAASSSLRAASSASASASKKLGSGASRMKNHGVRGTRKPTRRPWRIEAYMPSDEAAVSNGPVSDEPLSGYHDLTIDHTHSSLFPVSGHPLSTALPKL